MVEQILVELVEVHFFCVLVAEHFDDFESVHVLFDKAVYRTRLALLSDEVLAALACDILHNEEHYHEHTDRAKRQKRRYYHHCDEHTNDHEQIAYEVGNAV